MEKGGLVIYEVENDKVKLVLGLGTSDKWDHIATVELSVQATGCLLHHWIARAILEPKSGSMMFLSVLFDQVPPLTYEILEILEIGIFFPLILLYLFYFLYLSMFLSLFLYLYPPISLFLAVRVQFVYLWVCVFNWVGYKKVMEKFMEKGGLVIWGWEW